MSASKGLPVRNPTQEQIRPATKARIYEFPVNPEMPISGDIQTTSSTGFFRMVSLIVAAEVCVVLCGLGIWRLLH